MPLPKVGEPVYTPGGTGTSRKPRRKKKRLEPGTPASLRQDYNRILKTKQPDPNIRETVKRIFSKTVTSTPVQGIFKALDVGRKPIQKAVLGKTTEQIAKTGLKGGYGGRYLIRPNKKGFDPSDVARFAADVLLSPTSYVTGGLGGAGRAAAKTALTGKIAKVAGKDAAQAVSRKLVYRAASGSKKEVSRPATVSQIVRRLHTEMPSVAKQVPLKYKGGVKLTVPFTSKGVTVVPGRVTTKVTAPISRLATRPSVVHGALDIVTPGRKAWKGGYQAAQLRHAARKADQETRNFGAYSEHVVRDVEKAFGKKGQQRAEAVLKGQELPKNKKELRATENLRNVLDSLPDEAAKRGVDMGRLEKYTPLIFSEKTRSMLGRGVPTAFPAGARAAKFQSRQLTKDLPPGLTTSQVNKVLKDEFGFDDVDEFFSEDTYSNLRNYLRGAGAKIYSGGAAKKALDDDVMKYTHDITKSGLSIDAVKKSGFAKADEAIDAAAFGKGDERLAMLRQRSPEEFDKVVKVAARKLAESRVATSKLADKEGRRLLRVESQQGRVATQLENLRTKQPQPRMVPKPLQSAIQRDFEKLTSLTSNGGVPRGAGKEARALERRLRQNTNKANDYVGQSVREQAGRIKAEQKKVPLLEKQVKQMEAELEKTSKRYDAYRQGMDPEKGTPWPLKKDPRRTAVLPQAEKEKWGEISNSILPAFNGKVAPKEFAEEVNSTMSKPKHLEDFVRHYMKLRNAWRTGVTVMWPAFLTTNTLGAVFNNWIGGIGTKHHLLGQAILRGAAPNKAWRQFGGLTSNQIKHELVKRGVGGHVASNIVSEFAQPGSQIGKFNVMARLNQGIENEVRAAAFLKGLNKYDGDVDAAAEFMFIRHGDYSDLTNFEKGVRNVGVPFYKWARTNVPFQIMNMLENPGKYQQFARLRQGLEDPGSKDPFENPPSDYAEESLSLNLPGTDKRWYPRLPLTDVNEWAKPLTQGPAGLGGPLSQTMASPLIAAATGVNLFNGKPLKDVVPTRTQQGTIKALQLNKIPAFKPYIGVSKGGEMLVDERVLRMLEFLNPASRAMTTEKAVFPREGQPAADDSKAQRVAGFLGFKTYADRPDLARNSAQRELNDVIKKLYRRGYADEFKATYQKPKKKKPYPGGSRSPAPRRSGGGLPAVGERMY